MFPISGVVAETPATGGSRSYNLFGLRLRSAWEFPTPWQGPTPAGAADIEIIDGSVSRFAAARAAAGIPSTQAAGFQFHYAPLCDGYTYLLWPGLFEFLISPDGRRIFCRLQGRVSWEGFQTYLLGQVLSFALVKQGIESLHGTVLVVDGVAVGFIGDCGSGKSSLAAAFLKAGHPLLTDDLLVLKEEGGGFLGYPSFPRIKLFPRIARLFFGERAEGVAMNPYTRKRIIPLGPDLSWPHPAPLKAIYVLRGNTAKTRPKRVTIRTLGKRRAFLDLISHNFNTAVQEPERLKRQFALARRVIDTIPVKSLSYPRHLARLSEVVKFILLNLSR